MEGMVNIFRSLSLAQTHSRWTPHFSKLVKHLVKFNPNFPTSSNVTSSPRQNTSSPLDSALTNIEPYVLRVTFSNTREEDIHKTKQDLLQLWEYLLTFVIKISDTRLQTRGYALIIAIMQRQEFSLTRLGFLSVPPRPNCSNVALKLAEQYSELLVKTFGVVMDSLSLIKENLVQAVQFCAQALAVFFFRLPLVGGRIIESLRLKQKKAALTANMYEQHKRRGYRSDCKAKQTINKLKRFLLNGIEETSSTAASTESAASEHTFPDVETSEAMLQAGFLQRSSFSSSLDETRTRGDTMDQAFKTTSPSSKGLNNGVSYILRKKHGIGSLKQRLRKLASKEAHASDSQSSQEPLSYIERNPDLFQWNYFHDALEANIIVQYMNKESNECLQWLSEKETFFITFLDAFIKHTVSASVGPVDWSQIAAYDLLVQCVWPLFKSYLIWYGNAEKQSERAIGFVKSTPAANYVENAFRLLLRTNTSLLNQYIYLTFSNTNIHAISNVEICIDHLSTFFAVVRESHSKESEDYVQHFGYLPANFNIESYWFGINSFLEHEHFQVLRKACIHLSDTLSVFQGEKRRYFVDALLKSYFLKLFLHWCKEVRISFQVIVVFKLLTTDRRKLPCVTDTIVFDRYLAKSSPSDKKLEYPWRADRTILERTTKFVTGRRRGLDSRDRDQPDFGVFKKSSEEQRNLPERGLEDISICSKIDAMVSLCLRNETDVPLCAKAYVDDALSSYAQLLDKYYRGVKAGTAQQVSSIILSMLQTNSNFDKRLESRSVD